MTGDDASPLAGTEVHHLRSERAGADFKVFVGRCGTRAGEPCGALYLTDANGFFGATVDLVRSLQLVDQLPPLLVVGIGYRMGALRETTAVRVRDLTPTSDPAYARLVPEHAEMGGAGAFLAFIREELVPWVEARHPVVGGDRTYFGHSLGGLFGVYAMLTAPETFRRCAIGSPSLWWHGRAIFELEQAYADAHRDLPAHVFFGIGSDETHEGRQRESERLSAERRALAGARSIDMVDDMERFVERLRGRGYPGLRVTSAVFPDEFHVTVPLLTLSRALRVLYDAPLPLSRDGPGWD